MPYTYVVPNLARSRPVYQTRETWYIFGCNLSTHSYGDLDTSHGAVNALLFLGATCPCLLGVVSACSKHFLCGDN